MISCKDEVKQNEVNQVKDVKTKEEFPINLYFEDTIFVNELYNGKINYKNGLDTITTSLSDVKKYRFIHYAYTGTKTLNKNIDSLKNIVSDTAWAENNRIIPLKNILFRKAGVYYIDGIITDEVSIENSSVNEKGKPMTRIITDEFRVTKKIVVIDKK